MALVPLQTGDIVSLKSNSHLIGVVEAINNGDEPSATTQDSLLLLHSPVSIDVRNEFLRTGRPPDGYAFVSWGIPLGQGASLVNESDLVLIDRSYLIGDHVQLEDQVDTKVGVVVNVVEFYTLEPIVSHLLGL